MEKIKYILTVIIILCTITTYAQPAQYTPMTASGYQMKRLKVDSTLHLPSFCGVPTLRGSLAKEGALAIDTCGALLYMWTRLGGWDTINVSGGGGATDTTSLSNRINLKLNISDTASMLSSYLRKIDTTNKFVNNITRTPGKDSIIFFIGGNRFVIKDSVGSGGGSIAVDTIFRTLGKDSIFYKKNGITYAIKDSVGTNPAPVGYYGAFQDTTTQTAASINTAYPVNLRVTDLSNGITISNNSKIKIANAGIYNIQFSLQLEKSGGSGNMIADIWLRKNGVNIDGTTGKVVLTGSANASPIIAAWNYVLAVSSNDSLELMWSTINNNVVIKAYPATSPHPSIPSAILTVTQQSGIMAGTGISPLDTANMLLPYLRKIDTATLSNRINLKLNSADTASLSNRINLKLNIADTLTMLSKYLRKTDTASLSNRINLKLNISDTTTLQPKSISSYSILANNTSATANVTAQQFRDTSGVYTGTITWTGTTAPSGATTHTYRLTQVGKCVTLHIALVFASNGSALTAVQMTLPTGAPTPVQPTGLTGSIFNMYPLTSQLVSSANQSVLSVASRGFLRNNTAANGYEIFITFTSSAPGQIGATIQYWTN